MPDVIEIAQGLIACPSITPKEAGAQKYLAGILESMGFTCYHLPFGEVSNLFARLGSTGPHFCYAGHTDVVPPGPENQWTSPPFKPEIRDGKLYGRGASDMKGSVAAFVAAASDFLDNGGPPHGSISLLITGDEEGAAVDGTVKVLEWMQQNNQMPDVTLVGEPSNPEMLGQEIKIGRRGSLSGKLTVNGTQGHVAWPDRADNPLPVLIKMLTLLEETILDKGSAYFPHSNLEITAIDAPNSAGNVIPASGSARFNIRFNDRWTEETLSQKIREILDKAGRPYTLDLTCNAHSFITRPGEWSNLVSKAVEEITGLKPALTCSGGTSDARFIVKYCPVVEFGGINATIHKIDEHAGIEDLENLTKIYTRVLELYFSK